MPFHHFLGVKIWNRVHIMDMAGFQKLKEERLHRYKTAGKENGPHIEPKTNLESCQRAECKYLIRYIFYNIINYM